MFRALVSVAGSAALAAAGTAEVVLQGDGGKLTFVRDNGSSVSLTADELEALLAMKATVDVLALSIDINTMSPIVAALEKDGASAILGVNYETNTARVAVTTASVKIVESCFAAKGKNSKLIITTGFGHSIENLDRDICAAVGVRVGPASGTSSDYSAIHGSNPRQNIPGLGSFFSQDTNAGANGGSWSGGYFIKNVNFKGQHSITANPNDNVCVSLWVGADRSEAGFFVGGSRSGGDDNGLDATMVVMEVNTQDVATPAVNSYETLFNRVTALESNAKVGAVVQAHVASTNNYFDVNGVGVKVIEATITLKSKNPKLFVTANFGHGISRGDIDIAAAIGYKFGSVSGASTDYTTMHGANSRQNIPGLGSFFTQDTISGAESGSWSGNYFIKGVRYHTVTKVTGNVGDNVNVALFIGTENGRVCIGGANVCRGDNGYETSVSIMEVVDEGLSVASPNIGSGTAADVAALKTRVDALQSASVKPGIVQIEASTNEAAISVSTVSQQIVSCCINLKTDNPRIVVDANFGHGNLNNDIDLAAAVGWRSGSSSVDSTQYTAMHGTNSRQEIPGLGSFFVQDTTDGGVGGSWGGQYFIQGTSYQGEVDISGSVGDKVCFALFVGVDQMTIQVGTSNSGGDVNGYISTLSVTEISS